MPNTISIGNAHNAAEEWLQGELHSQDTHYPRIPSAQDTQGYSKILSDTQHSLFARLPSAAAGFVQVDK